MKEYIGIITTEQGYYYTGIDSNYKTIIDVIKEDIEVNNDIISAYVLPCIDYMPDADADPLYIYNSGN